MKVDIVKPLFHTESLDTLYTVCSQKWIIRGAILAGNNLISMNVQK